MSFCFHINMLFPFMISLMVSGIGSRRSTPIDLHQKRMIHTQFTIRSGCFACIVALNQTGILDLLRSSYRNGRWLDYRNAPRPLKLIKNVQNSVSFFFFYFCFSHFFPPFAPHFFFRFFKKKSPKKKKKKKSKGGPEKRGKRVFQKVSLNCYESIPPSELLSE